MSTNKKTINMEDRKVTLSMLWLFVMLNILAADTISFLNPEFLKGVMTGYAEELQITQGLLLAAAIMQEIPIAMVLLSRVLKYRANRWANIIAGAIKIALVIGMGSTSLHYIFFATIEVVGMLLIIWYAWKWPKQEA